MRDPRRIARLSRRVANPILAPIVVRLPGFGMLVHRGRRSGREYRTPVRSFRRGDRLVFALTYGTETDWVRNVLAAVVRSCRARAGRSTSSSRG